MSLIEKTNELGSVSSKIDYLNENINKDNIEECSEVIKGQDVQKVIQFLLSKSRNKEDIDKEELYLINSIIKVLQSIYNYDSIDTGVSDSDYDRLYEIISNNDIEVVSTPVLSNNKIDYHKYPSLRGTLDKIYALDSDEIMANPSRRSLLDFVKTSENIIREKTGMNVNLWEEEVYVFPKWDGVSCIFQMENNMLDKALTRGFTETNEAENITHVFSAIKSKIPSIGVIGTYGLKTEIMCHDDDLEYYNKKYGTDYKNTRSIVASILNSQDIDDRVYLLQIQKLRTTMIDENGNETLQELADEAFKDPFIRCKLKETDKIKSFALAHKNVKGLRCDGAVIHIINKELQNILGRKNHKNKYEVAYKFTEEIGYTKIKEVNFNIGLFGTIAPVAVIKPIKLKGNTISNVSLGSIPRFKYLNLAKNDKVRIRYDIIPYLEFDVSDPECKRSGEQPFELPTNCPDCGELLTYRINKTIDDGISTESESGILECSNPKCPCRIKGKILNYLRKMNIDGISYAIVSDLYNAGYLKSIKDLYRLEKNRHGIISLPGFGETLLDNIMIEIDDHSTVDDYVLLGSIGIPGISKKKFKKILDMISLEELLEACENKNIEVLKMCPGIEQASAIKIIEGISDNIKLIDYLLEKLTIIHTKQEPVKFSVCFTKIRSKDIEDLIKLKNGRVDDNVTKTTDILVVPSLTTESNSVEKAKKYGTKIIPISDITEYINSNY